MRRRLSRILLNAATAVSLVLCVTTVVLWVRSYWVGGYASYWICPLSPAPAEAWAVVSRMGRVEFLHVQTEFGERRPGVAFYEVPVTRDGSPLSVPMWERRHERYGSNELSGLTIPHWAAVTALGFVPLTRWIRRRRLAVAPGLCITCGYDLRATPDRCPECGAVPPPPLPPPPSA